MENDVRMVAAAQIAQQPQAQYSLHEQLTILRVAANRLGLYDAADFVGRYVDQVNRKEVQDLLWSAPLYRGDYGFSEAVPRINETVREAFFRGSQMRQE
jgi:hypothetical protein